jgi:glycerol-3-phosphate dehydrogenase
VLGTWLYWLLGGFFTRRPRLSVRELMSPRSRWATRRDGGFEYSDAYLHDNDARFVWNFVKERSTPGARR